MPTICRRPPIREGVRLAPRSGADIDRALAIWDENPELARREAADDLSAYCIMLNRHIDVESEQLMKQAKTALSAQRQEVIRAGFHYIEAEELGAGFHEKYHGLAMKILEQNKSWLPILERPPVTDPRHVAFCCISSQQQMSGLLNAAMRNATLMFGDVRARSFTARSRTTRSGCPTRSRRRRSATPRRSGYPGSCRRSGRAPRPPASSPHRRPLPAGSLRRRRRS